MLNKILMPSGGQTVDEMVILKWYKAVGDSIEQGDILFEMETDKAILTVESYASGTLLEIKYPEGTMVKTGAIVAYVGRAGDTIPQNDQPGENKPAPVPEPEIVHNAEEKKAAGNFEILPADVNRTISRRNGNKILASPLAKRHAKMENISLEQIASHFSKNLIKKNDVERYIAQVREIKQEDFYFIDASSLRRTIAKRTMESAQTSPHYFISMDMDMGECIVLRNSLNANGNGIKISYHDIIMKVVSKVIESYPLINANYQGKKIKVHKEVNFGLAVALEGGLVVPLVKQANRKSISEIAAVNIGNIEKARNNKLEESDISGGTITLSNLGMYGVNNFTAIINQPESCILALGGIVAKTVVVNREMVIRDIMNITGSFDHRIIDGAVGAAFLQQVKKILENPQLLLL